MRLSLHPNNIRKKNYSSIKLLLFRRINRLMITLMKVVYRGQNRKKVLKQRDI